MIALKQETIDTILENKDEKSAKEIAKIFNVSKSFILKLYEKHNIKKVNELRWTKKELNFLYKWYPHFGSKYVAQKLKKSRQAISVKASKHNIKILPCQKRLCYYCKTNFCHKGRGNRCKNCYNKRCDEYYQKSLKNDLLGTRLKLAYKNAKKRAKKSKLEFTISLNDIKNILNVQNWECYYSGIKMSIYDYNGSWDHTDAISVDRIDSKKGYTSDNIVLCCRYVNVAKSHLKYKDFLSICQSIVDHHDNNKNKFSDNRFN